MNRAGFYSRKRQFFREWRVLWRMHGLDTILGGLYVLVGFYLVHRVGISQVYEVSMPFIIASFVAGYLTWVIGAPQSRGNTLPFYFNLPRDRTAAWDAQLAYLVCAVLWMEAIILIGVTLKLSGTNITPTIAFTPKPSGYRSSPSPRSRATRTSNTRAKTSSLPCSPSSPSSPRSTTGFSMASPKTPSDTTITSRPADSN